MGECFQWKSNGQCSRGDPCSSNWLRETVAEVRDEKDNRPLPHQIRRPRLTVREKIIQNNRATEMKALQTKRAKFRADTDIVIICHVVLGILPYVKTTSLRLEARLATNAIFDMLRRMRMPAQSKCEGISCFIAGVFTMGL